MALKFVRIAAIQNDQLYLKITLLSIQKGDNLALISYKYRRSLTAFEMTGIQKHPAFGRVFFGRLGQFFFLFFLLFRFWLCMVVVFLWMRVFLVMIGISMMVVFFVMVMFVRSCFA